MKRGARSNFVIQLTKDDAHSLFGTSKNDTYDSNGMYGEWIQNVEADERKSIVYYTGIGYSKINDTLRKFKKPDAFLQKDIDNLDSAISKFNLKKSITVYRGAGTELIGGFNSAADINRYLKGTIVHDDGFTSTSAVKGLGFSSNKVYYEIEVPKGKGRGMWIEPLSAFKNTNEYEFLLKRATPMKIMGAKNVNGKLTVKLRVI